jgi:hypothetical protein
LNRFLRGGILAAEILIFSALIVATRCANYEDVFVGGQIYFSDADCYARMTRVRMCLEHPGRIVRHHSFENFPAGTTPHTMAPFDYLIAALSLVSGGAIDFAGAIVSPLLALFAGWFLWWWSRRMALPYRGALLLVYAISPILVHGAELGRPDHQSLLLALLSVALCAEWTLSGSDSQYWSLVSGAAWGLALWVSLYEPLILLVVVVIVQAIAARKEFVRPNRLWGWALGGFIVLMSLAIEQRLPVWPGNAAAFARWAATIGELNRVPINDPIWLRWLGLLVIPLPAFLWIAVRRTRALPVFLVALLVVSFALTAWQARWSYFLALIFALALPACLSVLRFRIAGWLLLAFSLWPILKDWDERLWPGESQTALRLERRAEALSWRAAARQIDGPFLAPWWWSPAVAYWSGQPGVAGSSHEALAGIEQSARFFLATDVETARAILSEHKVAWVMAYDADRTLANSAAILGIQPTENALGRVLDRTPSQAPPFLRLSAQNSACKLFRVHFFQEN